jgi:hypothetical protein
MRIYKNELINALKFINEIYFLRKERDFSYELYHQLRKLNLNIDITAETPKCSYRIPESLISNLFFKRYFFQSENFDLASNCFNRTPDLLFHEYENRNNQLIAVEIKPLGSISKLIYRDVAKLLYYTKSNLQFRCGIMILFSPQESEKKINELNIKFQNVITEFPEIEIWIIYPRRVHVIWAGGKTINEIY